MRPAQSQSPPAAATPNIAPWSRGLWLAAALMVLTLAVLAVASWMLFFKGSTLNQDMDRFTPAAWAVGGADANGFGLRYRMVGDMLRRHNLVGMTRPEVDALLGHIEYERVSDTYPYHGWDLGSRPGGFGMPFGTTLMVQFGPDGRVVKVWNPGR